MRRYSIAVSLLILTLTAASSPILPGEDEISLLSRLEFSKTWSLVRSLKERRGFESNGANDFSDLPSKLEERQTYNCTDLAASFDYRCWNELDLSGYLNDPETGWNHTVRMCSEEQSAESNDGADCCKVGEAWTTCYLRLGHGTPGQDCSQINSQFCSYQSTLAPDLDPSVKPQVQYVMKNIYCESSDLMYLGRSF